MKKRLLSTILILVMICIATIPVFAAETTYIDDGITQGYAYLTFDVKAPHGSIVIVEPYDYKGTGVMDKTGNITGEFGTAIFDDLVEPFFMMDPRSYLEPGDYYYKVTLKDKGVPNVEYDDSEYIVWLYIDYETDEYGRYLKPNGEVTSDAREAAKRMSIVLQKDDEYEKPLGIEFENCLTDTRVIKRKITYTEYTPDGKEVSKTVEEVVTLKRRVRCDSDGNPIDKDGNTISLNDESKLIYVGENGNNLGYDSSGRPYMTDKNGAPLKDENGNTVYTTKWTIVSNKRDGVELMPGAIGADGRVLLNSDLVSPDHRAKATEGWTPDIALVNGWIIDLNNPPPDGYEEWIPVVYTPTKKIRTGDESNMDLWSSIAAASMIILIILLAGRKKRSGDQAK